MMALSDFPNLTGENHQITSPISIDYNCIAWAVEDQDRWWWPHEDGYWPLPIPTQPTVADFVEAYGLYGYVDCTTEGGILELNVEKIAIYANQDGPTHAARQLPDGRWTSKLGPNEDITHNTLEALNGVLYGNAVCFLRRPRNPI